MNLVCLGSRISAKGELSERHLRRDRPLSGVTSRSYSAQPRKSHSTAHCAESVFVDAPEPSPEGNLPASLKRLVRKFDPVMRDLHNRALGKAGEEFVVRLEVADSPRSVE